jgi:hypothetical protein
MGSWGAHKTMKPEGDITLKGVVLGESPSGLAVRFRRAETGPEVWLPRSLIAIVQEAGEFDSVTMPLWLAEKKGIA